MAIKIEVTKLKDIRGRRIVGYRASFADLQADGDTPQDALDVYKRQVWFSLFSHTA